MFRQGTVLQETRCQGRLAQHGAMLKNLHILLQGSGLQRGVCTSPAHTVFSKGTQVHTALRKSVSEFSPSVNTFLKLIVLRTCRRSGDPTCSLFQLPLGKRSAYTHKGRACLTFLLNINRIHFPGVQKAPEYQTKGQFKILVCDRIPMTG